MLRRAGACRSPIWMVPVPVGQPFVPGTALVGAETYVVEPAVFVATTATRRVLPAAACANLCVELVAPLIVAQLLPCASQRIHAKAYDVGLPLHVPWLAVTVEPTSSGPETLGAVVGVGALAFEITADGALVA